MGFRPEELQKLLQKTKLGETRATDTLDGSNTTEIIRFTNPVEKVSYQADDATLAANAEVSVDGELFVAGNNLTAGNIVSYDAHLIRAIRFTRTAGSGKVVIVGR